MEIVFEFVIGKPESGERSEIELFCKAIGGYMAYIDSVMEECIKTRNFPSEKDQAALLGNSATVKTISTKLSEFEEFIKMDLADFDPLQPPAFPLPLSMKKPKGGGFSEVELFENLLSVQVDSSIQVQGITKLEDLRDGEKGTLNDLSRRLKLVISNYFE